MSRTSTVIRFATAAITATALLLGTTPDGAQASLATSKPGWHRLGTLTPTFGYERPTLDVTANGRWLAVAQRIGTLHQRDTARLVRGRGSGHADRVRYRTGKVLFSRIDRAGSATLVGFDSRRGLVAVTWMPGQARPRLHSFHVSGYGDLEVLANVSGDLVIHWDCGDRRCIIRKPAGERWGRMLKVGRLRYDGSRLADVAIDGRGRLVGAFLDDATISLRTLGVRSRVFGRPHKVLSVPGYAGPQPDREKHATIAVGPAGDRVVTLSLRRHGEDVSRNGHVAMLPVDGDRWNGEWFDGSFDDAVVGASGRVTVQLSSEFAESDVVQWKPGRKTFRRIDHTWLIASAPRGDVLLTDLAPNVDTGSGGHYLVLPDGRRPPAPVRAIAGPQAPIDVVGTTVYVARMTDAVDRWVLSRKTIRS